MFGVSIAHNCFVKSSSRCILVHIFIIFPTPSSKSAVNLLTCQSAKRALATVSCAFFPASSSKSAPCASVFFTFWSASRAQAESLVHFVSATFPDEGPKPDRASRPRVFSHVSSTLSDSFTSHDVVDVMVWMRITMTIVPSAEVC